MLAGVAMSTAMAPEISEPMTQGMYRLSSFPDRNTHDTDNLYSDFSYPSTKDRASSSPEQSSTSKATSTKSSPPGLEPSRVEKRKANTLAARRYRQKRVDQMSSLETELKDVKTERDDFRVRCAKLEGEVETLRALLQAQK